jgi:Tfp pilus assembly major pilin PilA
MKYQRGVTLSGLLIWGIIIAVVAMLGLRVTPDVIDYYKIKKIVASTAANAGGKTVPEIRAIFGKYADVDHIQTITPADLDISKEGNEVVIAFAYEKRIPLFMNVSLLIDFQGSSAQR